MGKMRSVLFTATFAFASLSPKPNIHSHFPYLDASFDIQHACARDPVDREFAKKISGISSRLDLGEIIIDIDRKARREIKAIKRMEYLANHPDELIREQALRFLRAKFGFAWFVRSRTELQYFGMIGNTLRNRLGEQKGEEAKLTARQLTEYYMRNGKWGELTELLKHPNPEIRVEVRSAVEYRRTIPSIGREIPKDFLKTFKADEVPDLSAKKQE